MTSKLVAQPGHITTRPLGKPMESMRYNIIYPMWRKLPLHLKYLLDFFGTFCGREGGGGGVAKPCHDQFSALVSEHVKFEDDQCRIVAVYTHIHRQKWKLDIKSNITPDIYLLRNYMFRSNKYTRDLLLAFSFITENVMTIKVKLSNTSSSILATLTLVVTVTKY